MKTEFLCVRDIIACSKSVALFQSGCTYTHYREAGQDARQRLHSPFRFLDTPTPLWILATHKCKPFEVCLYFVCVCASENDANVDLVGSTAGKLIRLKFKTSELLLKYSFLSRQQMCCCSKSFLISKLKRPIDYHQYRRFIEKERLDRKRVQPEELTYFSRRWKFSAGTRNPIPNDRLRKGRPRG